MRSAAVGRMRARARLIVQNRPSLPEHKGYQHNTIQQNKIIFSKMQRLDSCLNCLLLIKLVGISDFPCSMHRPGIFDYD